MNGPKKIVSKLPTLFNKTANTNDAGSNGATSTSSTVKRPTVLSARNLRRSRSAYDMPSRPFSRPFVAPTFTSTTKKPTKRPGTTLNAADTKLANTKRTKPVENAQNIAPQTKIRPKAAPYDFKTKFNYVKEDYDKLKIVHRELKEQQVTLTDQNEELLTKNETLQTDLDTLNEKYTIVKSELDNIKSNYDGLIESKTNLEKENDALKKNLESTTKHLNINTKELDLVKRDYELTKESLSFTSKALDQNKLLVETLKEQLYMFEKKQREMHNTIQELKGNIRVFCRIRPPLPEEKHKILYDVNYVDEKTIELLKNEKKSEFSFDKVFGPNAMQEDIFEELSQLVQSALDGYNVCIFAYGQTGSGKTYTMDGIRSSNQLGMIPRSVDLIFKVIEELQKLGWTYVVKTSFLEIYNENIVDLLEPRKSQLDIRMVDTKSNDVYVTNLSVIEVENAEELKYHSHIAQKNRATAATENNERSSRSHSVTKIILEGFNKNRNEKCSGSLNLVDLAGSEKFYTNETTRLRETTNINKSLSNLSNVILALVRKTTHVPYRNSKLTHLLMPCLGGNSKTLMLVNISPLEDCYHESVNSLRFATTVNQCKTGSIKKQKTQQLNERVLRSENSFCK